MVAMDPLDLERMVRRPLVHWFQDGLVDILIGLGLSIIGVMDGLWGMGSYAMLALSLFALFLGPRVVIALKRRFVFPRTGSVEYSWRPPMRDGQPMSKLQFAVWVGLAPLVAALAVLGLGRVLAPHSTWLEALGPLRNLVAANGLGWACVLALMARQTGRRRYLGLAALSLLVAPIAGIAFGAGRTGFAAYVLTMAAGFLLLGVHAFVTFRRHHPPLDGESDAS
jgi:hypothetical protein